MNRRDWLTSLPLWAVLASWHRAMPRPAGRQTPAGRLAALFPDPESVAAIGRRYLEQFPSQADPDALWFASGLPEPVVRAGGPDARRLFEERRARDFLDGRIVYLDGWVLARSEVACGALLALS